MTMFGLELADRNFFISFRAADSMDKPTDFADRFGFDKRLVYTKS